MPSIFIEIRDFFYLWLTKNHGKEYAEKEYRFRTSVFWMMYYISVVLIIVLIVLSLPFDLSDGIKKQFKTNFFIKLIGGCIILMPYYIWVKKYLLAKLAQIPINEDCDSRCYKKKRLKAIVVFIGGFLFILLIGALNNLIRFGHL